MTFMDATEALAWELLEAECGKPLPFDVPTHAALSAIRAALTQQPAADQFIATFRCEDSGIVGTTDAKIHSVTRHDDGRIEVVIDHWPKQPDAVSSGDCTTDGANVWCNGQIVATAHGFTLRSYRAARIAECLNACAGIDDPAALVQAVRDAIDWIVDYVPDNVGGRDFTLANLRRTLGLANEESRSVTRQLLHWGGVPVHVTGTVTTSPGNWSLIDAAPTEYHNE